MSIKKRLTRARRRPTRFRRRRQPGNW